MAKPYKKAASVGQNFFSVVKENPELYPSEIQTIEPYVTRINEDAIAGRA